MQDWQPPNPQPYSTNPVFPGPTDTPYGQYPYPGTATSHFEYGSFLRRLVAVLLDGIILLFISILVWVGTWIVRSWFDDPSDRLQYLLGIPQVLVTVLYVVIGTSKGGTWGYRGLKLQVTTPSGGTPSILSALLREWAQVIGVLIQIGVAALMYANVVDGDLRNAVTTGIGGAGIASGMAFIWFCGCFLVLFDDHKQALHDKIASTYVIHKRS